ncbi:hypothetical protein OR571_08370 [Psychrobacillus sp. NEAU-3TGS]|uniref:hypothetical protein n=1 Tax=Psychrobacillus sp. NEAU-3TGS TaxID=2995412 RepID=UPI0024970A40|nr:hypothetical protein [Psychrobacillus sp. NEAU-3TGS]MDI2587115.1 hypothetical protein [Psychrobacillus sp. NEAU-3TGS]
MRKNWSPYVWKLIWTIGLIVLLMITYRLEFQVKNHVATTFQMLPIVWFQFIANLLLGIYLSILFIKEWTFKWNWSFFICLTIPFFVISIYLPVAITFVQSIAQDSNNFSVPFPQWLMKINTYGIPAIVTGITLMSGLFSKTSNGASHE